MKADSAIKAKNEGIEDQLDAYLQADEEEKEI
jgi:hypothetical protein